LTCPTRRARRRSTSTTAATRSASARASTLRVYRPGDHPEQYFVAFTDSTTGNETYGGGRYAHLDSLDEHRFVLDFNQAYNPYCAYDTLWMCPLPPRENRLPFAVRAGMTKPVGGHE
jgi:hypothetical protein